MDSEIPSDHGHHEEDTHHAKLHSVVEGGEGEQDEHHHHKSVLKKVKEKAKKIKDSIKKHGHGHNHNHDHDHDHESTDEEDDDDEIVDDPEVHGAPMYDSAVIRTRSINPPRDTNINVERPSVMPVDKHEQDLVNKGIGTQGPMGHTFGELPAMANLDARNMNATNVTDPNIKFRPRIGLEEDPHCPYNSPTEIPHSNYQSKVDDPTGDGGKEANVDPLVSRFGNLNVHNVFDKKPEQDRFAPQETPTQNLLSPESNPVYTPETERPDPSPEIQRPDSTPKTKNQDSNAQSTIAGKISAAATAAADTAISAKNAVASKMGYGGGSQGYSSGRGGDTAATVTMKDYLAEKVRPGDEDKALSEVITDALTKKNESKAVWQPGSKVKVSAEVAARLGPPNETKREGEDALAAGAESSGQGVVDRLRDAVGAWLGKSEGMQTAQDSIAGSYVSDPATAGGAKKEN